MSGTFEVIQHKLDRAKEHAATYSREVETFLDSEPHGITVKTDPEPPFALHCIWKVREPPPVALALILGDILSNLRATLDYLVWQLVLEANNTPTDRTAFPCVKVQDNWPSAVGDRLVGVDSRWVEHIKQLQPCFGGDRPERHLLAVLDHINNINKHRTLQTIVTTVPSWRSGFAHPDLPGRTIHVENWLDRPMEDGTEFYRLSFDPPLPEFEFTFDSDPPRRVSFLDGLDRSDGWTYTNADLIEWVENAIAVFEPAFGR